MFMMPLSAFTQDESFPFAAQYGGHEDSLYMPCGDTYCIFRQ